MAKPRGFENQRNDLLIQLEQASTAGTWLPLAGLAAALIWWGAAIGALLAIFGLSGIQNGPAPIVATSGLLIFLPGFLMIMSGLMARQSVRSAQSNAIVLSAAAHLLTPTNELGGDVDTLVAATRKNIETLNEAMRKSVETLKTMSDSAEAERLKIESVSYVAADNARDLTERMSGEREALESLTRNLKQYMDLLNDAIPRQALAMATATDAAHREITAHDKALEARLEVMEQNAAKLVTQLNSMKTIAEHAHRQTNIVQVAVDAIEKKLDRAQSLVRNAEAAGNMAADAVADAGKRLDDAVTHALSGTREMAEDVARRSEEARLAALKSMAALETASGAAAASFERLRQASVKEKPTEALQLSEPAPSGPEVLENLPPLTPPKEATKESDSALFEAPLSEMESVAEPNPVDMQKPGLGLDVSEFSPFSDLDAAASSKPDVTPGPGLDDELFGEGPKAFELPSKNGGDPKPGLSPVVSTDTPLDLPFDTTDDQSRGSPGWRSILAEMDLDDSDDESTVDEDGPKIITYPHQEGSGSDDAQDTIGSREKQVRALVERLTGSGIRLGEIFKAKDKRRIATASDKSEQGRRQAVRKCAGREIDRLTARLRNDPDLRETAAWFFEHEADSAIDALMASSKSNRNASPELAAFLLIDAAIGGGAGRAV